MRKRKDPWVRTLERLRNMGHEYELRYLPARGMFKTGFTEHGTHMTGWKRIYRGEELAKGRFSLRKTSRPIEQGDVGALFEPAGTVYPYSYDTRAAREMPYRRLALKRGKLRSAVYGISKKILVSPAFIQIADNIYLQKVKPAYKEKGYIALVPARRVPGEKKKVSVPAHLTHFAPLQATNLLNKAPGKLIVLAQGKTNIEILGPEGVIYRAAVKRGRPDSWMALALRESSPVGQYGKEKAIIRDEVIEDITPNVERMIKALPAGPVSVAMVAQRLEKNRNDAAKRFVQTVKSLEPLSKDKRIELRDAVTEILFGLAGKGLLTYKVNRKGDRVTFSKT